MPRFSDDLLLEVISDCFRAFSLPEKVKPLALRDIWLERLDDWDSAPGMPWKRYGYLTKADVACDKNALDSIILFWDHVKKGRDAHIPLCCGQAKRQPTEQKNRVIRKSIIWGYPCTAAFQEACFALPLEEGYRTFCTPIAYAYRDFKTAGSELYYRFRHCNFLVCLEFKKFAKNVPDWLIQIAFDILGSNVNWIMYEGDEKPHCEKLHKAWKKLMDYFQRTPVHFRHGTKYCKPKGVCSGSYFTEMIYSIITYIVIQYCVRYQRITVEDQLVLGDESLLALSGKLDISCLAATAGKFNLIINLDRIQVENCIERIMFLGNIIESDEPDDHASKKMRMIEWEAPPSYQDSRDL